MPYCNNTLMEEGDKLVASEQPLFGNMTFHQLGLFITAAFAIMACAISIILMLGHAMHYTVPHQQKHIIRILAMIPIYSIISFVSYWQFSRAIYWQVLRDCYEAFAIASFFALLCQYIEPSLRAQKDYFRRVPVKNWVLPINWLQKCTGGEHAGPFRKPKSGLTFFNIIYVGVFQYCFIRVFFTMVSMFSQLFRRYCETSINPAFAHIWVLLFEGGAVTIAMYCLIQFYLQLKDDLAEHKPFLKIICIKLVIFFSFWQNFLISFLTSGSHQVLKPSPRIAYPDLVVGIPAMLLTIEMTFFAALHHFAFPWKVYDNRDSLDGGVQNQGGALGWRAWRDAFNPWDFIKASARGFRWLFVGIRNREQDAKYSDPNTKNGIDLTQTNTGSAFGASPLSAQSTNYGGGHTTYDTPPAGYSRPPYPQHQEEYDGANPFASRDNSPPLYYAEARTPQLSQADLPGTAVSPPSPYEPYRKEASLQQQKQQHHPDGPPQRQDPPGFI